MELSDFDYNLPKGLIAQKPVTPKDHSRLMVVGKKIEHKHFYDIINYLKKDDVLVINDTKVSRAKIQGKKITGGKIELILCNKLNQETFEARISGNKIRAGQKYIFADKLKCEVLNQDKDIFTVKFNKPITDELRLKLFELPTPPYVKRKISKDSEYQTVYSKESGSVAAPTAGLHFTKELLKKIQDKGIKIARVCLHVDFGTFLPVRGKIQEHKIHKEYFEITKENADIINKRKARLIAVGTTSVRALESSCKNGKILPTQASTDIFIYPGYKFKIKIDALITNFHFPKSTLLMLVSAYFGREKILEAYKIAVKEKYSFYSLGDAMLLNSQPQ